MNVYSSQPLADFIDQLRALAEAQRFGHAFIAKLDELAGLEAQQEEIERLEFEREELENRIAELEEKEGRLGNMDTRAEREAGRAVPRQSWEMD